MVAIVKKTSNLRKNLNEILQIVSVNIFEQHPLSELLADEPAHPKEKLVQASNQNSFLFKD